MKSSTRLDSAVFQLTPTRTRFDLVISANGRTEKIDSGLLNPFLANLKTAQEQVAKGGYSIIIKPEPGTDAAWFTRGTVERFVRFVNTPEVLERVYTLESEILQMEEAIAIQSNNDLGLSTVEEQEVVERKEGGRPSPNSNEEKAIVLYQPGANPPEANESTGQEANSKVQLMKVLEMRKSALQKEQGMAFARAVAAGFDMNHIDPLMSFAKSFGASRLKDACSGFMELWKRKHETGQWVEIEEAKAMVNSSSFSPMNGAGIVFPNGVNQEMPDSNGKAAYENPHMDQTRPPGHQEHFQGQFPHPMFPSWPVHSLPGGLPVFSGFSMQGVPYYQSYPGNGPFFQPPHMSGEDIRNHSTQRINRRHSMDSNVEHESWEVDALKTRSEDEADIEEQSAGSREPGRRGSRSGKKKSGMVVIKNINYISSKRQVSSGSESESESGSGADNEDIDSRDHIKSKKSIASKRKESHKNSMDNCDLRDYGEEADGGQWQAFQNYLLKDAEEAERASDHKMFAMEKDAQFKKRQSRAGDDPLALGGRRMGYDREGNMVEMQNVNGKLIRVTKSSNDESFTSRTTGQAGDGTRFIDVQSAEVDGKRKVYRITSNDGFVLNGRDSHFGYTSSSTDPLVYGGVERARNDLDRRASHNMDDDSYIVSLSSNTSAVGGSNMRNAIDLDSELPREAKVIYEPDELNLMPERGTEAETTGYDLTLDYDMQVHAGNGALIKKSEGAGKDGRQVSMKSEKDASNKKKVAGPIRKGKPSKLSPMDEARARAEKLRTYKADLQKMKKEKEEEEMKRLQALKLERQKRIVARSGSIPSQSSSKETKKQLPTKLSPSSLKGSKFSDSAPGPSSPLQTRFPSRTLPVGSPEIPKRSKSSKLSTGSQSAGSRVVKSVSSLPEPKKEDSSATPDTKVSISRIRRLSEPKTSSSSSPLVSSVKPLVKEQASRPKVSKEPESKKITAIVDHDKNKTAALPALKIKTPKGTVAAHGKSTAKEMPLKMNVSKSTADPSGSEPKIASKKNSHQDDGYDGPIIEKSVVLEYEKSSVSASQLSEENKEHASSQSAGRTGTISDHAANNTTSLPPTMDGVDRQPRRRQSLENVDYEVSTEIASHEEKEMPYRAPYARVSSLEDPCTVNAEYGKAPPTTLQTEILNSDSFKARVLEQGSFKLEKIPETSDKPQPYPKESSKGFKRLLKFGRKNHSVGDRNSETDNASFDGSEADAALNAGSSSEVHTLKNLISQDETPTAGSTPQKTSRHFSLLSPFRSKNSEKKSMT